MISCPACGHESPDGSRFCAQCGGPLEPAGQQGREERKLVTILFADLVGFTSRSERLDPEDVRALLSPYYARLRKELERFGGTVEKFIGDAVMAVFGAPVAHEDDPERAVRAALAIRDWVSEQDVDLQLRIAVNTGEALVSLGARASEGEGMVSGDVVNSASRLQTAAPVNGILVGEMTHRATAQVIDYREAEAVSAKGKSEPMPAWEAIDARARFGIDLAQPTGPLIGREEELRLVDDTLNRVRRSSSSQLLTIVGVPGIGKSRLVAELFRMVHADPNVIVLWRQGRSLPYGEGVTFWALSEMVKAQAGILESDSVDESQRKLTSTVHDAIADEAEAQWVENHLRPLAGLGSSDRSGDRQNEAFTAWRHFFEALAEQHPLALVFEDMQWADDSLLDFVENLIDWSSGVPLLVVCTTRPELLERRSGWGGGKRNATTLSLAPLSDDDTARLISSLSGRPVLPLETQQALILRSGGNPLYAEQFVRMQEERGDSELPLPETVQGIIGARLDALSAGEKDLLQNAAVMGKVFWLGGVSTVAGVERDTAELHLHALERKEFVQRARRSAVAGDAEFAFLHILVRDVAYGQIPRGRRAEKHRLAAEWLETLGRTEDHAEMLAYHYSSAVDLLRAAGQPVDAAFASRVLESLRVAGDRALSLNAYANAATFYESALELAPDDSRDSALLLFKLGRTHYFSGSTDPALLSRARDALLACHEPATAAEASVLLADMAWLVGDTSRMLEHLDRARGLVAGLPPSRAKAYVVSTASRFMMLASKPEEAIRVGREALAMAEQLGDAELRAHALNNIGVSQTDLGDETGIEALQQSIVLARESGSPHELCRALGNFAATAWEIGQPGKHRDAWEEGRATAKRFGQATFERWFDGQAGPAEFWVGRWDESLAAEDHFIAEVEAGAPHYLAATNYSTRALLRVARDEPRRALADVERGIELAQSLSDPQARLTTMIECLVVLWEVGERSRAEALLNAVLVELRPDRSIGFAVTSLHMLAWSATALGRGAELRERVPQVANPWSEAAIAFAGGDLRRAADIAGSIGAVTEEAHDRLCLARSLLDEGNEAEGRVELQRALDFYRSVGATRYIREGEALLAQSA